MFPISKTNKKMSLENRDKICINETENQIKILIEQITLELEREISIRECRQATSKKS